MFRVVTTVPAAILLLIFLEPAFCDAQCSTYPYTGGSGKKYKIYNDQLVITEARDKCASEGATLPILHYKQDAAEVADAVVWLHNNDVAEEGNEYWIGLTQIDQHKYRWDDGWNLTLREDIGLPTNPDHYERFSSSSDADRTSTDTSDCFFLETADYIWKWDETTCDDDYYVLCICPAP